MTNVEPRNIEIDGVPVVLHGQPEDLYFYSACMVPDYDGHLSAISARSLGDDGVLLDVGANIGYYAMSVAARCSKHSTGHGGIRIHSFEPASVNLGPFRQTIEANQELAAGISLHPFGLSDQAGTATLTYLEGNTASAHIAQDVDAAYTGREQIELRTLDSVIEERALDRIDLIKIDIEGHERVLLEAIAPIVEQYKPALLIEVNQWVIDVMAGSATSVFVDYICSLAPFVYGVDADGTYIDVQADRIDYLRANLLARTHQDLYVDFDESRVQRALNGMRHVHG